MSLARLFNSSVIAVRYLLLVISFCFALISGAIWLYLPPIPDDPSIG